MFVYFFIVSHSEPFRSLNQFHNHKSKTWWSRMNCRTSRVSGPTYGEKQWGQFAIDSGCNEGWLTWTNCCPLQCLPPHPLVIPTPSTSSKNHQKSYILLMYAVHLGDPQHSLLNETCTGLWNVKPYSDSLQYSTYATIIT